MKSVLLSFDIEEFDLPTEFGAEISRDDMFAIAGEGSERILNVVNEAGVRTTFFVTAAFAQAFPDLVRRMKDSGHEIASHGYANEVGEAFRSLVPAAVVWLSYGVSSSYSLPPEWVRFQHLSGAASRALLPSCLWPCPLCPGQ